jgi:hypothetical protein
MAFEIELTHKSRRTYETEVFGNLRAGTHEVFYFVPDEKFRQRLRADVEAVLSRMVPPQKPQPRQAYLYPDRQQEPEAPRRRYRIELLSDLLNPSKTPDGTPHVPGVTYMGSR